MGTTSIATILSIVATISLVKSFPVVKEGKTEIPSVIVIQQIIKVTDCVATSHCHCHLRIAEIIWVKM